MACAQDKWDLKRCVEYALMNNISIRQSQVQASIAELTLQQSRLSQIPSLNFGAGVNYNAGRTQNPANYGLTTTSYWSSGYSLQGNVLLFNWFSKRNTVEANRYNMMAAQTYIDKVKSDIALNVAAAYLQALLAQEQIGVTEVQVKQSNSQLDNTRKLVDAGSLPELNAAELEAQLASDSSTLVTAKATAVQAVLNLKALLFLDASVPFDLDTPPVDRIPVESLADLQPEAVFALAVKNLPLQQWNALRIKGLEKVVRAQKGAMFPTVNMSGSLGTNAISNAQEVKGQVALPPQKIGTAGADTVYSLPSYFNYFGKRSYWRQLDGNFGQSIGASLNVPIFNAGSLRTNYRRSKLDLQNARLQKDLDNQTLKQDIYKAYNDATSSLQKWMASVKSVSTAQKAYEFSLKRYNIGLLNSIDLITNQNKLFRARIDALVTQYDYVFRLKVLEFYKGMGIRLQ